METDYPQFLLPHRCRFMWFFYMARFYVMPWLMGYSVMGMLSFPLEGEIWPLRAIQIKTALSSAASIECFERLNHQRLAHHHGNQDQPADHENTETQQDDIGG